MVRRSPRGSLAVATSASRAQFVHLGLVERWPMTMDHHEIEDTYAVGVDADLPSFDELSGVDTVQRGDVHEREPSYFNPADLALATGGITLRRRTGGADPGWHVKLPMQKGRF